MVAGRQEEHPPFLLKWEVGSIWEITPGKPRKENWTLQPDLEATEELKATLSRSDERRSAALSSSLPLATNSQTTADLQPSSLTTKSLCSHFALCRRQLLYLRRCPQITVVLGLVVPFYLLSRVLVFIDKAPQQF